MEQVWNRYGTDGTQNVIHTHQQNLIHTPHKFRAIYKSPLAAFTEAAIWDATWFFQVRLGFSKSVLAFPSPTWKVRKIQAGNGKS